MNIWSEWFHWYKAFYEVKWDEHSQAKLVGHLDQYAPWIELLNFVFS